MNSNKFKQAPTKLIWRSEIQLAHYNPRTITEDAFKGIVRNIKRLGLMGGIVVNETTKTLVSGHQRIGAMDEIQGYNPETKENDYQINVVLVSLSEKEEKEQNLFMNSLSAQGEFDSQLLTAMLPDIELKYTGIDEEDLNVYITELDDAFLSDLDNLDFGEFERFQKPRKEENLTDEERKERVKKGKQENVDNMGDDFGGELYVTVSFTSYGAKVFFMELLSLPEDDIFVKGEEIVNLLTKKK